MLGKVLFAQPCVYFNFTSHISAAALHLESRWELRIYLPPTSRHEAPLTLLIPPLSLAHILHPCRRSWGIRVEREPSRPFAVKILLPPKCDTLNVCARASQSWGFGACSFTLCLSIKAAVTGLDNTHELIAPFPLPCNRNIIFWRKIHQTYQRDLGVYLSDSQEERERRIPIFSKADRASKIPLKQQASSPPSACMHQCGNPVPFWKSVQTLAFAHFIFCLALWERRLRAMKL